MYMNLKPNQKRKIKSFNTTTMTSSGFIAPLKFSSHPNLIFLLRAPQLFCSEIFRSPPIIRGLLPCCIRMKFQYLLLAVVCLCIADIIFQSKSEFWLHNVFYQYIVISL